MQCNTKNSLDCITGLSTVWIVGKSTALLFVTGNYRFKSKSEKVEKVEPTKLYAENTICTKCYTNRE